MKNQILHKIKQLNLTDNFFRVYCKKYMIEFRLFQINKITFLAISGAGVGLSTYFIHDKTDYEDMIKEIEIHVFRGIDLNIEDSIFIENEVIYLAIGCEEDSYEFGVNLDWLYITCQSFKDLEFTTINELQKIFKGNWSLSQKIYDKAEKENQIILL